MVHKALEAMVAYVREHPAPMHSQETIATRRSDYLKVAEAIRGEEIPMESVTDVVIPLEGRMLQARHYVPLGDESKALVLYFHGGSFCIGDLETHDGLCRALSESTKMRCLAIEYRLAPEHPFPEGINDTIDSLRYVSANLSKYADKDAKLIVFGDSSGGNFAAVGVAQTRNENLNIVAQVLINPAMGPEIVTESSHAYGSGFMLDNDQLRSDYLQYLNGYQDHTDPRVSPLMASDLTNSPPAIVVVAECDPLRDEGVAYAGLLEHFGVEVELLEAEGMTHGFLRLGGIIPECFEIVGDLAEHMHRFVEKS